MDTEDLLAKEDTFQGLVAWDYVVIVLYFAFVLAVGLFVSHYDICI